MVELKGKRVEEKSIKNLISYWKKYKILLQISYQGSIIE